MPEKNKVPVEVDEKVDELLSELARAKKVPKEQIIADALKTLIKEVPDRKPEEYIELSDIMKEISPTGMSEDPFDKMLKLMLVREFSGKSNVTDGLDLNKILAFAAIKQMLTPDPMTLLAVQRMQTDTTKDSFWQQYMQQQQQMQQNLMTMLFGQRIQETEKRYQDLKEAISERMEWINQQIANLEKAYREKPTKDLASELEEWVKKKQVLEEFAETIKPKEIVTDSGKINWGKLLDRAVGIGEKFVEKLPVKTPEPKPIKPLEETQPPLKVKTLKPVESKTPEVSEAEEALEKESYEDIVQVSVQEETPKEPPKEMPKEKPKETKTEVKKSGTPKKK